MATLWLSELAVGAVGETGSPSMVKLPLLGSFTGGGFLFPTPGLGITLGCPADVRLADRIREQSGCAMRSRGSLVELGPYYSELH